MAKDRGNAEFGRSASEVGDAAEVGRTENHPVLPGPGVGESVPDGALPYRTTQLAGALSATGHKLVVECGCGL